MKKRFTETQIVGFLREAAGDVAVKELCRKHWFSEGSYYTWRRKFGGMSVSDAKRLTLPREIADISDYPQITIAMQKRGYSDQRIRKILGLNLAP